MFSEKFVDLDVVANGMLLFVAGSETVAATASFCLYELSFNKDIQNRLRAEIKLKKQKYNGKLSINYLMELNYCDMVINGNKCIYNNT